MEKTITFWTINTEGVDQNKSWGTFPKSSIDVLFDSKESQLRASMLNTLNWISAGGEFHRQ